MVSMKQLRDDYACPCDESAMFEEFILPKIVTPDKKVREKDFQCFEDVGRELSGKQAGIIGLGRIGTGVAKLSLFQSQSKVL